jgi:hypothetical protein
VREFASPTFALSLPKVLSGKGTIRAQGAAASPEGSEPRDLLSLALQTNATQTVDQCGQRRPQLCSHRCVHSIMRKRPTADCSWLSVPAHCDHEERPGSVWRASGSDGAAFLITAACSPLSGMHRWPLGFATARRQDAPGIDFDWRPAVQFHGLAADS